MSGLSNDRLTFGFGSVGIDTAMRSNENLIRNEEPEVVVVICKSKSSPLCVNSWYFAIICAIPLPCDNDIKDNEGDWV